MRSSSSLGFEPHHLGTEVDAVVIQSDHAEYAGLRSRGHSRGTPGRQRPARGLPLDLGGAPDVVVVGIGTIESPDAN